MAETRFSNMTDRIAALQDFQLYRELHWEGRSRTTCDDRARQPAGDPQRIPAHLRHDRQLRDRGVHRQQEEARPLQLLQGRAERRRGRDFRARHPAHAAGARASRPRPRGTAPRSASSCCTARWARRSRTIARLLKQGVEQYSRTRRRGPLHLRVDGLPRPGIASGERTFPCPMHEEPLRLIPPDVARPGA